MEYKENGISQEQRSKEVLSHVNERLVVLHSLKQHRFPFFWEYRNKYKMQRKSSANTDYVDYGMNTQFAVINTKAAELLANTPKFDFVALDENAKRYRRVRELHWDYVWQVSGTDRSIYSIVFDALKYGVGCGKEIYTRDVRKVRTPYLEGGEMKFKEEEVVDYEGCRLVYVPWKNFWVNGPSIELATEAAVVTYYDRSKALEIFGNNPMYRFDKDSIPKGKYYYVNDSGSELSIDGSPGATDFGESNVQDADIVSVLEYWDKYKDEYYVLMNGVWINPLPDGGCMPNTNPSKEIPLVLYADHPLEDDAYCLGEYDISNRSAALKDDTRSLAIETVRAQGGIITIDPDSDFDDNVMELGIRKFARVAKDDLGFFAPSINASTLQYMEGKVDEDIIIETGIDFRNQLLSPDETATKTEGRIQAALKRISLNVKYNAYNFWNRLARLRMANMEFYSDKAHMIPVKGMDVDNDGNVVTLNNSYGLFTMKPEYFAGKFSLLARIDSMVGDSTSESKQKYLEMFQLLAQLVDRDTGKPLYDPRSLIEAGRGIIDEVIDLDKISEKKETTKTPDQILKELDGQDAGMPGALDAGFVPPEQRSGKAVLLPSSPGA